jgi:hypothetical protein
MSRSVDVMYMASDLEPGETLRDVCPRCNGGASRESSLTITLDYDGGVVWNCFRDRCDEKGRSGGTGVPRDTVPRKKVVKRFEGTTVPLSDRLANILRTKWGVVDPPYWYWTNDYGGRVAMSIRSPKYIHRGWVLRDIRGVARSKALTYIEPDEVQMSWYKVNTNAPTVVVEDIPSAVRVASNGVNAVALLGTLVNEEKAIELREYASMPIVIALDQDATLKAFRIAREYGLLWDDYEILPLQKDFKDMTDEEIQTKLGIQYEREACTIVSN